jgi:multidrug transporter EmrE-like cation transporter
MRPVADTALVICLSLGSALAFAAANSLKHASAADTPYAQDLTPAKLAALIGSTVRNRLWLAGISCDAVALALQVTALHLGTLTVVQPLLVAGLLVALVFRRGQDRRQVTGRQLAWTLVVCACLAGFVSLATAPQHSAPADRLPAVASAATGAVIAVACVALGRRLSRRGSAAALLGVAVGLIYAAIAALLKSLGTIAATQPARLPESWQLYATVVLGASGLLLTQLAFQAGPLAASLPAATSVNPLASIAVGVAVYDEQVRVPGVAGLPLIALLLVLAVGVVQLARSAAARSDAGRGET